MKTKHTKGPWTVEYSGDGISVSFGPKGTHVFNTVDEDPDNDNAELFAAACLVEAAPELLEAAKRGLEAIEFLKTLGIKLNVFERSDLDGHEGFIKTAIRKAEGGSNE